MVLRELCSFYALALPFQRGGVLEHGGGAGYAHDDEIDHFHSKEVASVPHNDKSPAPRHVFISRALSNEAICASPSVAKTFALPAERSLGTR